MNTLVDNDTFNLLFDKGYNEWKSDKAILQTPTIADVITWLYEKHNIWIIVTPIPYCEGLTHWRWEHKSTDYNTRGFHWKKQSDYLSPTEAYLEAIKYCLTKLI